MRLFGLPYKRMAKQICAYTNEMGYCAVVSGMMGWPRLKLAEAEKLESAIHADSPNIMTLSIGGVGKKSGAILLIAHNPAQLWTCARKLFTPPASSKHHGSERSEAFLRHIRELIEKSYGIKLIW